MGLFKYWYYSFFFINIKSNLYSIKEQRLVVSSLKFEIRRSSTSYRILLEFLFLFFLLSLEDFFLSLIKIFV